MSRNHSHVVNDENPRLLPNLIHQSREQAPKQAEETQKENAEQQRAGISQADSNSRFYTKEYLQHKNDYLISFRAHLLRIKDTVNFTPEENSRCLEVIGEMVQREAQDVLQVEESISKIAFDDLGFSLCMDVYFEDDLDDWTSGWSSDIIKLLRSEEPGSPEGMDELFLPYGCDARDIITEDMSAKAEALKAMGHLPRVRYVPAQDVDNFSDSSSIDVFGDDNEESGKTRQDQLWEKSDLPDVYLERHRAACGFCCFDFQKPRRVAPADSGLHDFSIGVGERESETQELPEPLIRLPCSHVFHRSCFYDFVLKSAADWEISLECPTCRREIPPASASSGQSWGVLPEASPEQLDDYPSRSFDPPGQLVDTSIQSNDPPEILPNTPSQQTAHVQSNNLLEELPDSLTQSVDAPEVYLAAPSRQPAGTPTQLSNISAVSFSSPPRRPRNDIPIQPGDTIDQLRNITSRHKLERKGWRYREPVFHCLKEGIRRVRDLLRCDR